MSEISADRPINVVIQHPSRPGLIAGLFGCAFGILGIFTFGFIFAPLGLICAIAGFALGLFGRSFSGVGTSMLAGTLSIVAALKSPVLMLLFGVSLLASLFHQPAVNHAEVGQSNVTIQSPSLSNNPTSATNTQANPTPAIDEAARLNRAADWAVNASAAADTDLAKVPGTDQRYRDITAQMERWAAERSALPQDQALRRGQLGTAISQAEVDANLMHDRVTLLQTRFQQNAAPNAQRAQELIQACQGHTEVTDEIGVACARLVAAMDPLDKKFAALTDGLNGLENTYQQEHARQQQIVDHLYD